MVTPASGNRSLRFLHNGGDAGRAIGRFDWSTTPLGDIAGWSATLTTAVGIMVRSPAPMVLMWGRQGTLLYNDGYAVIAGKRHPGLLGTRVRESWPEIADFNDHVIEVVLAGGSLTYRDQELRIERNGEPEQAWFTLDYSPVLDEQAVPVGVLAVVVETTANIRAMAQRQIAEKAVKDGEVRNRQILDSAIDYAIIAFDLDGKVTRWNEGAVRVLGWTEAEMLGQDASRLFTPEDRAAGRVRFEMNQAERTGVGNDERWHIRKSGERFWASGEVTPILDDSGEAIGFVKVLRDRTEQHRALRMIEESAAQFRSFAQAQPNHVWTAPPDGQLDWFNDRVYEYSGASPGELDGGGWTRIVHPDDVVAAGEKWRAALDCGTIYETEFRIRRADGEYRWHLARALPMRDADGAVSRWVGTNTDIHERKIAEAQSARDRERIWTLAQELMMVCDLDGVIAAVNPAATRVLGWEQEEMVGAPVTDFLHADDVARTRAEMSRSSDGLATLAFENRYRAKDGSYRVLDWTGVPEAGYIHAVARDRTEERAREHELRLAQDALRQSQKMEAVGQLTGGLAHDFNNLLAGISASLQVVGKRLGERRIEGLERHVSMGMEAVRRAASLTQRLLAFSRRQTLDPKPVDVNRLARGMEDLIRRTVGPTIDVVVAGTAGLWTTKVDPSQLEGALLNLCINARDAMQPDGGRLTIETSNKWLDERAASSRELPPGQYIHLSVTDTGAGMSPDVIEHIFEPFFTTKPLGAGTGLGLSMVYGFVRQSGGQVHVVSDLGQGTRMNLYLPRYHGDVPAIDATADEKPAREGEGESVLVVDDEPAVRELIAEMLVEIGYRVHEASDGPDGLAILQSSMRIDLLITDVGLPGGLNGRQVADAARARRPDLKVLFVTGYAESAVFGSGHLDAGMRIMTKPFELADLANKVRDLLDS